MPATLGMMLRRTTVRAHIGASSRFFALRTPMKLSCWRCWSAGTACWWARSLPRPLDFSLRLRSFCPSLASLWVLPPWSSSWILLWTLLRSSDTARVAYSGWRAWKWSLGTLLTFGHGMWCAVRSFSPASSNYFIESSQHVLIALTRNRRKCFVLTVPVPPRILSRRWETKWGTSSLLSLNCLRTRSGACHWLWSSLSASPDFLDIGFYWFRCWLSDSVPCASHTLSMQWRMNILCCMISCTPRKIWLW